MSEPQTYLSLFSSEEQETIRKLEAQRVVLRRKPVLWAVATTIFIVVMVIMGGIIEIAKYTDRAWPFVIMLVVTLMFFGFIAWITFKFPDRETLARKYKRLMLRRIVPFKLPGWVTASSHRLMNEDIRKSGLFRDKANRIAREDYLFGPVGKVVAEVYQIALQSEASSNRDARSGVIIQREVPTNHFYGYFFRIHCPIIFPCETWVFPKKKKAHGQVDDWAELTSGKYARSQNTQAVETGDAEFDSAFVVYSNDVNGARHIISPLQRKNILELNRLFSTAVAVSYTGNKVYVMIGYDDDPMDISLRKPIGEALLHAHADELARMKDVALLVTAF